MISGWTIYDHPKDYPNHFVARRWIGRDGEIVATEEMFVAETLDEARKLLPPGLFCFPRAQADDPVIIECWM